MYEKTITYTDYDGAKQTQTFNFNLNKAELAELALSRRGGLDEYLKAIVASEDGAAIISTFKDIISKSIGRREGPRFVKSDEIRNDFLDTEAYSTLFMELVTNADAAAEFIREVVPADLASKIQETEDAEYTDQQLIAMPQHQFDQIVGTDPKNMSKRHLMLAFERRNHKAAS